MAVPREVADYSIRSEGSKSDCGMRYSMGPKQHEVDDRPQLPGE
jgi:hypothetical protein